MMAEGRDPRQKPECSSILRMAIELSDSSQDNADSRSAFQEMDPDRREWLRQALCDTVKEDDIVRMRKCLDILQNEEGDDEESINVMSNSLEMLQDIVEEIIDNSVDLHKIGGLKLIGKLLQHPSSEIRWRCAEVIAQCTQNNPFCQKAVVEELKLSPVLSELLDSDEDDTVRVKALYAISCLVRQHQVGKQSFVHSHGLSILMRAMQTNNDKLKVKSAFLLRCIIEEDPESCDSACSMGMVEQLVTMLNGPIEIYHEYVLGSLLHLVTNKKGITDCLQPELHLHKLLTNRIASLNAVDPEQYQEQIEHCTKLLEVCFKNGPEDNDDSMSR